MFYAKKYDPLIKRLPTVVDLTDDIQKFDIDNIYPWRVEEIRNRSYRTVSCCAKLANFINGEGFEDQAFSQLVINESGHTANDVLNKLSPDYATHGGFVAHLTVNLNGQYNGMTIYPWKNWRLGLPDDNGDVYDVKYNTNWEQDYYKQVNNAKRILTYPVFNPDPEFIKEEIELWGVENYPGQVLYFTPQGLVYPLCTFDSVLDQAQTEADIALFRLSAGQNGFQAGHMMFYPGTFETPQKKQQFKDSIGEFTGPQGGNALFVLEDPTGEMKINDIVKTLQMQNVDKIHEFTSQDTGEAIRICFGQPMEILGESPKTGMFNKENILEAYTYYNSSTRDFRTEVSGQFKKVFSNWHQPVTQNFKIKPQVYSIG